MIAAATFEEILVHRGQVVVFTPTAAIGLYLEQVAERSHAHVVTTRGWADKLGPLQIWRNLYASREYGVLSCNQETYCTGCRFGASDLVWVGDAGDPRVNMPLYARFSQAMLRTGDQDPPAREWLLALPSI